MRNLDSGGELEEGAKPYSKVISVTKSGPSRRQLLGVTIGSSSSALVESADELSISGKVPWQPSEADKPDIVQPGDWQFFTEPEREFIDGTISRLIPNDNLSPSAKGANVTIFLDRQMAGPYGKASHWYMQGPWKKGEPTQGYQSRLLPAELCRTAIKAIEHHCKDKFGGKHFAQIPAISKTW